MSDHAKYWIRDTRICRITNKDCECISVYCDKCDMGMLQDKYTKMEHELCVAVKNCNEMAKKIKKLESACEVNSKENVDLHEKLHKVLLCATLNLDEIIKTFEKGIDKMPLWRLKQLYDELKKQME